MAKIVCNRCWGGFSISKKAQEWLVEKGLNIEVDDYGYLSNENFNIESENYHAYRAHPLLVECVETLKGEADGSLAELVIVEIPDEILDWEIDNYDGMEHVTQTSRNWY